MLKSVANALITEARKENYPFSFTSKQAEVLARAAMTALRDFEVMKLTTKYPQPMFFDDAWIETFDVGLNEPA
jgi:hypothetical protein